MLCSIEQEYIKLMKILNFSVGLSGMTNENKGKGENEILPQINARKDELVKTIREYLFSLKGMPNGR